PPPAAGVPVDPAADRGARAADRGRVPGEPDTNAGGGGPAALDRGPGVERGRVPAAGGGGVRGHRDLSGDVSPGDVRAGPPGGAEAAVPVAAARAGARGAGRDAPDRDRGAVRPARRLAVRGRRGGGARAVP